MLSSHDDLIFGIHAVQAALEAGEAAAVWALPGRDDMRLKHLLALAASQDVPVERRTREQMDKLAPDARHQGVMARLRPLPEWDLEDLLAHLDKLDQVPLLLILDGLQDPHNVGACLRSAEAAGVDAVILPKDRACPVNATVRKVASGAASRVPIVQVTNLSRAMAKLRDRFIWITGLAGQSQSLVYDVDLRGPCAIVVGAEGEGMRRLTREHCDNLVRIPMHGQAESLNVSVAAGVTLFEVVRQRLNP